MDATPFKRDVLKERLQKAGSKTAVNLDDNLQILRDTKMSGIPLLNRLLAGVRVSALLRLWLLQARLTVAPGVLVLSGITAGALFGYGAFVMTKSLLSGLTGALVGVGLPAMYVWNARRTRFGAFAAQLPDALRLQMLNCLPPIKTALQTQILRCGRLAPMVFQI